MLKTESSTSAISLYSFTGDSQETETTASVLQTTVTEGSTKTSPEQVTESDAYSTVLATTIENPTTKSANMTCSCGKCRVQDPEDCTKYGECLGGEYVSKQCDVGYLFSSELERCDLAENVGCDKYSEECSSDDGFLADTNDCSSYVHCYHGISYKKTCPTGLFYNPVKRTCDKRSNCGAKPHLPASRSLDVDCDCDYCIMGDSEDCSKYYLCLEGVAYDETCGGGLLFDAETATCDHEGSATCSKRSPECETKNGDFSFPGNCSLYYHCVGGVAYEKGCFPGFHFNSERGQCEEACEAGCDPSLECSVTSQLPICESTDDFYPNPEDCQTFYECTEGVPKLAECTDGEHFNPIEQICQDPCMALCDPKLDCGNSTDFTDSVTTSYTESVISSSPSLITSGETKGSVFTDATSTRITPTTRRESTPTERTSSTESDLTSSYSPVSTETDFDSTSSIAPTSRKESTTTERTSSTDPDSTNLYSSVPPETDSDATSTSIAPTSRKESTTTERTSSTDPDSANLYSSVDPGTYSDATSTSIAPTSRKESTTTDNTSLTKPDSTSSSVRPETDSDDFITESTSRSTRYITSSILFPDETTETFPTTYSALCPEKTGVYPDPEECGSLYLCIDGYPMKLHCDENLHFNPLTKRCEPPCSALCDPTVDCSSTEEPETPTTESLSFCRKKDFFPKRFSCKYYYDCTRGKMRKKQKCPKGLEFNPTKRVCDLPEKARCGQLPKDLPVPDSFFKCPCEACLVPSAHNCLGYFLCLDFNAYRMKCSDGLLFDKRKNTCNFANKVFCDSTTTTITPYPITEETHKTTTRNPYITETYPTSPTYTTTRRPYITSTTKQPYTTPTTRRPITTKGPYSTSTDVPYTISTTTSRPRTTSTTRAPYTTSTSTSRTYTTSTTREAYTTSTSKPYTTSTTREPPTTTSTKRPYTTTSRKPSTSTTTRKPYTTSTTRNPFTTSTSKPYTTSTTRKAHPTPTTSKPYTTSTTRKAHTTPTTSKPYTTSTTRKAHTKPTTSKPYTTSTTRKAHTTPTTSRPYTTSTTSKPSTTTTSKPSTTTTSRPYTTRRPYTTPTTTREPLTTSTTSRRPYMTSTTKEPSTTSTTSKPYTTRKPFTTTSSTSKPYTTSTTRKPTTKSTTSRPYSTSSTRAPYTTSTSTSRPYTTSTTQNPYIPSTTKRPYATSTTTKPASTVAPTQRPFRCPEANGMFRNPKDCGSFIHCSYLIPYRKDCPAGLHFSMETKRCEYPCRAKCDKSLACTSTSTAPPTTPNPLCPCKNCLRPNPESCTKFIECKSGQPTKRDCPKGQTFDTRFYRCDWAHRSNCQNREVCPKRNGLFPHRGDCHKFVLCSNGIPYTKVCPPRLQFDPSTLRCTYAPGACASSVAPNGTEEKLNPTVPEWRCPGKFGYFRHEGKCNKYYHCIEGIATLKECPEGLHFNSKYGTCDWPKNVNCRVSQSHLERRCRVFREDFYCPSNRSYSSSQHCDMFYDCRSGKACIKSCPEGLFFNYQTSMCDLPANVRCKKSDGGSYSLKRFSEICRHGHRQQGVDPATNKCYYKCHGDKVRRYCCSRNRVYNEKRGVCQRKTLFRLQSEE